MELLKCKCGNEMYPSQQNNRDHTGRKLDKPICKDCFERGVRSSVLTKPQMMRLPSEVR
ncbi:hypothetical protein UFOVP1229_129 [uncultured Caudovirales phage]|uniref:Uncharacterized protein n=1 Tax=uncultured Caudovirales phage TaxID=2100421 RepID=A0A6J5RB34_9CAUD|nr:hypothetical protein UFOVP1229_129 [uncultured Caudovirales phage]